MNVRIRLYKFSAVIFTSLILLNCCSSKSNCKTKEDLITSSIEAINNQDLNQYIALIDFMTLLKIWQEAAEEDTEYQELVDFLLNEKGNIIKSYSMSYLMLTGTLKKKHKLKKLAI